MLHCTAARQPFWQQYGRRITTFGREQRVVDARHSQPLLALPRAHPVTCATYAYHLLYLSSGGGNFMATPAYACAGRETAVRARPPGHSF